MKKFTCLIATIFSLLDFTTMPAQTIAEKKAGIRPAGADLTADMQTVLIQLNKELRENQTELQSLYQQVLNLFQENASECSFKELLDRINIVRDNIQALETNWRDMAVQSGHEGGYSLWQQPESTLGQLIIDYGSHSFVYVMPPEIASIKVSVDSNIPIPRASWNEMIELILNQNGIGIRQLNPFLRQLYLLKQDKSGIQLITNCKRELAFIPPETRICFMLAPEPSEVRRIWAFLDKFINPNTTVLQMIGRDILIIATAAEVQDILKLYDFVASNTGDKEYKIRALTKVNADEMAKILGAIFDQFAEAPRAFERLGERPASGRPPMDLKGDRRDTSISDVNGLKIIALRHIAQAIFLIGTKDEIKKAEEIINQVENQVGESREKIVWWYTTKHSDPEELAQILYKIYALMVQNESALERHMGRPGPFPHPGMPGGPPGGGPFGPHMGPPPPPNNATAIAEPGNQTVIQSMPNPFQPARLYTGDFYMQGGFVVNPAPVEPRLPPPAMPNKNRDNFIVDLKTGAIVMVVEADILPKIKDVIKKLDVPKRMVQIEALVFEKRLRRHDSFGLNLLRLGDLASNQNISSVLWNTFGVKGVDEPHPPSRLGIFDFILSREGNHGIPAFDLVYRFLIQQEDIQINANPTVVTMNQSPATISIVDEISINTGVFLFNTGAGITPQNSFTRAQYGITIIVTPTIHITDIDNIFDDNPSYVTLDTDITFDTFAGIANAATSNGQPDVTRRHITNQVSIPDGQTVVIGGLRRKNTDDFKNSIPYLGEIPGFGKLFSTTSMQDDALELFIFLTPKIISDPSDDFCRLRAEEMNGRPGDIPEFMCALIEAEEMEKNRLYAGTMNVLFGRPPDRFVPDSDPPCNIIGEYDGR
jgi:general secretion pathway protein D